MFLLLEEQIVVTATRTKSKIKDAPAAVYVITRKQMEERGYRTLIDALKDVPGLIFNTHMEFIQNLCTNGG
ncbi:MAG: TonB-dependent receptor plug domain-containing protein [Leptospiraceae bacterium]|nr:TonB-dependent receptor plug domain-containing protein [Leptospiraceae bacterium]